MRAREQLRNLLCPTNGCPTVRGTVRLCSHADLGSWPLAPPRSVISVLDTRGREQAAMFKFPGSYSLALEVPGRYIVVARLGQQRQQRVCPHTRSSQTSSFDQSCRGEMSGPPAPWPTGANGGHSCIVSPSAAPPSLMHATVLVSAWIRAASPNRLLAAAVARLSLPNKEADQHRRRPRRFELGWRRSQDSPTPDARCGSAASSRRPRHLSSSVVADTGFCSRSAAAAVGGSVLRWRRSGSDESGFGRS
jgi:hypothetical protein